MKNAAIKEIITALNNGVQFSNEAKSWFSIVNVSQNRFLLDVSGNLEQYNNVKSVAKRIFKLINY